MTFPALESRYPSALIRERQNASASGRLRDKIRYDLIGRPQYAFGLLTAADIARFCGVGRIIAIEFGVANGGGLLNLCKLAPMVTEETGVEIEIVGFDTGAGLPAIQDYRDHPEIWSSGDFLMDNREELVAQLPPFARIIWGDIADTIGPFADSLASSCPVGFVANDVDIYSSTKSALQLYRAASEKFLPVTINYFDDTIGGPGRIGSLFRNRWAGQLLAIDEFNAENALRKLDILRVLKHRRPLNREKWLDQIYGAHFLDHPARNRIDTRAALTMNEHGMEEVLNWPL